MKYYVIEIQRDNDGKENFGMYSYNTKDEALKVFYQKMSSGITAGLNGTVSFVLNKVMNDLGNAIEIGRWVKPEPEPEPVEPEENTEE